MSSIDFESLSSDTKQEVHKFISHNSFCLFVTDLNGQVGISHINLISKTSNLDSGVLYGHVSKGNAQSKQLKHSPKITALFMAEDILDNSNPKKTDEAAKIAALHLEGELELLSDNEELKSFFDHLISKYESFAPNPWKIDWSEKEFSSQMSGIIGFKFKIKKVEVINSKTFFESMSNNTTINDLNQEDKLPILKDAKETKEQDTKKKTQFLPLYLPPSFKVPDEEGFNQFMQQYPNCVVINKLQENLCISYMQYLKSKDNNIQLKPLYLSNLLSGVNHPPLESAAIFRGPHSYISPRWYQTPFSVPTWNYTTAYMYGPLSNYHEGSDKLKFLNLNVQSRVGKFKLNQNRTLEDRLGVIHGICGKVKPSNNELSIAHLMKQNCPMQTHNLPKNGNFKSYTLPNTPNTSNTHSIHNNRKMFTGLYNAVRKNKRTIVTGTLALATALAVTYYKQGLKP